MVTPMRHGVKCLFYYSERVPVYRPLTPRRGVKSGGLGLGPTKGCQRHGSKFLLGGVDSREIECTCTCTGVGFSPKVSV